MKRLPPSQVIAEYQSARARVGMNPANVEYRNGWFIIWRPLSFSRHRGAQIIHMTAQLNERAKAKG